MPAKRDFKRKSGLRDSRLIVIASEGEETERQYFEGLKARVQNPRVHVEVLRRMQSASDPAQVIRSLDQFRSEYRLRRGYDQLWLVIDVDRWRDAKLSLISQECMQKSYLLAVSNPSFEIWLLLHVRSLDSYEPESLAEFGENMKKGNRTRLSLELLATIGSYNKSNLEMDYFYPRLTNAIRNARLADRHPETRWPNHLGTRVYLLAEEIVETIMILEYDNRRVSIPKRQIQEGRGSLKGMDTEIERDEEDRI